VATHVVNGVQIRRGRQDGVDRVVFDGIKRSGVAKLHLALPLWGAERQKASDLLN
jgi:hypothetical protein